MTAVSIPHPPPRLARAANGLPLTAAVGRRRANAHGGGRRRGHSRDMAEGDGTATVCVALLTRAFWTNMQETLAIAASSPVMRPTSIESRNTDLTGIVLNSDALWGHSCFKIHLPRAGSRLYVPAHAPVTGQSLVSRVDSVSGIITSPPVFGTLTAHRAAAGSAVAHNHIIEKHTAATPTAAPP